MTTGSSTTRGSSTTIGVTDTSTIGGGTSTTGFELAAVIMFLILLSIITFLTRPFNLEGGSTDKLGGSAGLSMLSKCCCMLLFSKVSQVVSILPNSVYMESVTSILLFSQNSTKVLDRSFLNTSKPCSNKLFGVGTPSEKDDSLELSAETLCFNESNNSSSMSPFVNSPSISFFFSRFISTDSSNLISFVMCVYINWILLLNRFKYLVCKI